MVEAVDLKQQFSKFNEHWLPYMIGEVNDCAVKIAKFKGEFPAHVHEHEDELFLVVQGAITIKFQDRDVKLETGQFAIVPRGVMHQPVAVDEAWVMLFEPKSTINTGNIEDSGLTRTNLPRI